MRAGEVRALRWRHINLKTRNCKVMEAAKGETGTETGKPKWEKTRSFTMAKLTSKALEEWGSLAIHTAPEDFVFGTADGTMISHQVIKDAWDSMMKGATKSADNREPLIKLGDRWITPHSCRHSLNTLLLQAGCNALDVAEALGWSSVLGRAVSAVQAQYSHIRIVDPGAIADAIDEALQPKSRVIVERINA
jgi:integrase